MIPLELTIQGIYSYQQEHTINFEQLTQTQLFGIFGAVGSGKSSILEAISFALYGETERLNNRDSRAYNMMNLKSDRLLIDFKFYTDDINKPYRFVVKTRRNKKRFEDVSSFERHSYIGKQTDDATNWSATELKAEDIIGLNYKNFKRTIIIPQGKFREFLDLKPSDRTSMLNEIFNLERFNLQPKVTILKNKNEQALNILQGKMEKYLALSNEQLQQIKEQQTQQQKVSKEQQENLNQLQKDLSQQLQIKELFDRHSKAKVEIQQLNQQKDSFQKRKELLQQYLSCQQVFSAEFSAQQRLDKEIIDKQKQYNTLSTKISQHSKQQKKLESEQIEINEQYSTINKTQEEINDLQVIIEIKKTQSELKQLKGRQEKGDALIKEKKDNSLKSQNELKQIRNEIDKLKSQLGDFHLFSELKIYYKEQLQLENEQNKTTSAINKLFEQQQSIYDSIKSSLPENLYVEKKESQHNTLIPDNRFIDEAAQKAIKSLQKLKDNLSEKRQHLLAQEQLKNWADNLEDETPCPVCGSKDHPDRLNMDDVNQKVKHINEQENKLNEEILSNQKVHSIVEKADIELNSCAEQIKQQQQSLSQVKAQLLEHQQIFTQQFDPDNFVQTLFEITQKSQTEDCIEDLSILIKQSEQQNKAIKEKEKQASQLEKDVSHHLDDVEKFMDHFQTLKDQYLKLATQLEQQEKQIKLLALDEFTEIDESEMIKQMLAKQSQVEKITDKHDKISKTIEENNKVINLLQGQEKTLKQVIDELQKKLDEHNKTLQIALKQSDFTNLEAVKTCLNNKVNEKQEQQAINDFEVKLTIADSNFKQLEQEIKRQNFSEEKHRQLEKELAQAEKQLNSTQAQLGALTQQISTLEKDLNDKKQLQQQQAELEKRQENISVLTRLFKGQGFVKYISTVYLQNLCAIANTRFSRMTRQQLQLEINENNEFQVIDFLHGGKTRSVKTLSGGQLFQASLALALALADSVQNQLQSKQHFFFLDEGFGSLDNDALHVVFDTLKALKDENRIVGIISHVQQLQQDIEVYCQINRDEQNGSSIHYSWQ